MKVAREDAFNLTAIGPDSKSSPQALYLRQTLDKREIAMEILWLCSFFITPNTLNSGSEGAIGLVFPNTLGLVLIPFSNRVENRI
jgi:hypothetical protein